MADDWRETAARWHEAKAAVAREAAVVAETIGSSLDHQYQEVWHRFSAEQLRAEMALPKKEGKQR